MNILGLTCGGESGAALFQNGQLTLAVNEERLTRIKLDCSYPTLSIDWILSEADLDEEKIDVICYGFSDIESALSNHLSDINLRLREYTDSESEIVLQRLITEASVDAVNYNEFDEKTKKRFPKSKLYRCEHHDSHKYAAFYGSPFSDALIVTSDGRGDFKSLTVSAIHDGVMEELHCSYSWESLGYFYGRITKLCGFTPNRHEGKITGLAAHGNPLNAIELMKKMVVFKDGKLRTFPGELYRPFFSNYSETLYNELDKYCREDLAAAAQYHLENLMVEIIEHYLQKTHAKNVCLAGGVFSNVKLNQKIRNLDGIDNIFVYPNMSDAGICAGAIYKYAAEIGTQVTRPISSLYLGPQIDAETVREMLEEKSFHVLKPENINDEVCRLLENGKIIGLVQGRTEFGPRALGNRSIIASCKDPLINETINHRLGRTEFMPFAPSISINQADKSLQNFKSEYSTRHMTITYDVTPLFAKKCPAVVHVDNTARPQIVHEEDNVFFYHLLNEYYNKSGEFALVNTSFNLHEDPIISNEEDVIKTFEKGAVDYLLFPPYLCEFKK